MRGDGAAGCASGGCAGFSLLGLLVAVGLTVWLSSMALPDSSSPERSARTTTTVTASPAPPATDPIAPRAGATVTLDPSSGLADGATTSVTATGFAPGEGVTVPTCLRQGSAVAGEDTCAPERDTPIGADASGRVVLTYQPARIVGSAGVPFDCASTAGLCEVRVVGTGDAPVSGSEPFSFVTGLPAPEITIPD